MILLLAIKLVLWYGNSKVKQNYSGVYEREEDKEILSQRWSFLVFIYSDRVELDVMYTYLHYGKMIHTNLF